MRRSYDYQKSKFYNAEHYAIQAIINSEEYDYLETTVDEMHQLFGFIKTSSYYLAHSGDKRLSLSIEPLNENYEAIYYPSQLRIVISPDHSSVPTLCHEVAHHLVSQIASDMPAHGGTFCSFYLALLKQFAPAGCFSDMLMKFEEHRIDWSPEKFTNMDYTIGA